MRAHKWQRGVLRFRVLGPEIVERTFNGSIGDKRAEAVRNESGRRTASSQLAEGASGHSAVPRCGARTRGGTSAVVPPWRLAAARMHGGPSTGPRTPEGLRHANWIAWPGVGRSYGRRKEAVAIRREIRRLIELVLGA